jgi:NAD(P)H-hydrate epimerase
MKIFSAEQIKAWDAYTIENEPITSIDLMERASHAFVDYLTAFYSAKNIDTIHIFCGSGNNGGDGLAIARLLSNQKKKVLVYHIPTSTTLSSDFVTNLNRLETPIISLEQDFPNFNFQKNDIIIDAILGSGLNRNVENSIAQLIQLINDSNITIWSVDIPSGLFADTLSNGISIKANYTLTFETPKLSFFFPENAEAIGDFFYLSILLNVDYQNFTKSNNFYTTLAFAKKIIKSRSKFSHKGTFGHALLVAGSYGKIGAAVLSAKACLRSGVGLVSIHSPKCGYEILQTSVPEAMVISDNDIWQVTKINQKDYDAIGIGPGIGTSKETAIAFETFLKSQQKPLVIDADALNLLSYYPELQQFIPLNSILTPHIKEFERLFCVSKNSMERNDLQRRKAIELGVIIVLKGAHTCIALPDGNCFYNSTGNAGMATGGSGDVLTGIILSLLSQKYASEDAAILGVFLHGLAGDSAKEKFGEEALIANDIIEYLGSAFKTIHKY